MGLWTFAPLVFLLNLPFGYWRASVRRFSGQWLLALLLPLLLAAAPRLFSESGWSPARLLVLVAGFSLGQFVGGKVRHIIQGRGPGRAVH